MNLTFQSFNQLISGTLCGFLLAGCAFKVPHNKSMLEIRNETARNYSQQVLDAIAGVHERAELPLFFTVEAGSSTWSPSFTGSMGGSITPPWNTNQEFITPSFSQTDRLSDFVQYNDFGSAPMTRVIAIFRFLCYPFNLNTQDFPNGSLYTIVDIRNSKESFVISTKLNDGRYLGVTQDKQINFMNFVNDVMFWTRHDIPDPKDLQSYPGVLYKLSTEYVGLLNKTIQAVQLRNKIQPTISKTQEALAQKQKEYDSFVETALNSEQNDAILKTAADHKYEQLNKIKDGLSVISGKLKQAELDIKNNSTQLLILLADLDNLIDNIEKNDPEVTNVNMKMISGTFREQLEKLLGGDEETIRQLQSALPEAAGLKAGESSDDRYRERFESLPQQFNQNFQGTQ